MKRVLIVDDDQIVSRIYQNKLLGEGFDVQCAGDGDEALKKIWSYRPEVVLLDLMLPNIDGVEVLRSIRSAPETKDLPVIVLSNSYQVAQVQSAWKAGATKCLAKGNTTPRHLIEVLREVLNAVPAAGVDARNESGQQSGDLRRVFLAEAPAILTSLRAHVQALTRAVAPAQKQAEYFEIAQSLDAATGIAGAAGLMRFAQLAGALEALTRELSSKPDLAQPSTVRTITLATDELAATVSQPLSVQMQPFPQCCLLGVDDDEISRRMLRNAATKAGLKIVTVSSATAALNLLEENSFELILLDIGMPEMDGFEFCRRARDKASVRKTPILFASAASDFQSRVQSTLAGGTDIISKPYLLMELAVKATTLIIASNSGR